MSTLNWLWQDLRFGFRNLRKNQGFTGLAVLALALGIGATVVIFSVIDSILIDPLPYPNPGQRVVFVIHDVTKPDQLGRGNYTVEEYLAFRSQNTVFKDLIIYTLQDFLYTNANGTQQALGNRSTTNQFDVFGIKAILGRTYIPDDGRPGAPPVCLISYNWWTDQFHRDPKIVGSTIILNGIPRTIVGVLPPRVLPLRDVFVPMGLTGSSLISLDPLPPGTFYGVYGELKAGVTLDAANANLQVIARRLAQIYPQRYPDKFTVQTITTLDAAVKPFRGMLYALIAAVGMLLLIACSNVANLLLAQATAREKEIAIRATVGATWTRLVMQLLSESFLLAASGCILGVGLAFWGVRGAAAVIPIGMIPPETVIVMKPVALWFALAITLVTTLLCGLVPAIHSVGGDLHSRLMGSGKGAQGGFRHGNLRSALVVTEVALSLILLVGAGLMMRGMLAIQDLELGFRPANVLFTYLVFPPGRYDTADQKRVYFRQILQRVTSMPGVVSAAETFSVPPYGGLNGEVVVPGRVHSDRWESQVNLISEGYFDALGVRPYRGNLLSESDVDSTRRVAVINQTLARNFFGTDDPVGRTIKFNVFDTLPDAPHDAYFQIVGVVPDIKNRGVQDPPLPQAFIPYTVTGAYNRALLVKTTMDSNSMLPTLQKELWAADSNVALALGHGGTGTLEKLLQQYSYAAPKFGLIMFGAFAALGLLLVIIGVFSVMAYSVSLQTHDIGIRMSLGAQQADILSMVIRKGLLLVATGVTIGVLVGLGLSRVLASQVRGVPATDPWTFVIVMALLVVVGVAACLIPARRAMKVDPMAALRYE